MHKNIVLTLFGCLLYVYGLSQNTSLKDLLEQIEQNNQELKALKAYADSKRLELKSGHNLPDPELSGYYLPFGNHSSGDYTEFEISQSLEFPTVYGARNKLIDQQMTALELEYRAKRQEVLVNAKKRCLEMVWLNKRARFEKERAEKTRQVFEQVQTLYNKEQVGILELNKAKTAWLQEQFKVKQIETEKMELALELKSLNGGNDISYQPDEYPSLAIADSIDAVWEEKLATDPALLHLKQEEEVARQQLKLAKSKSLPDITAGFNSQGFSGERYSGLYAGISIPLWNNRNNVRAANARIEYQGFLTRSKMTDVRASFEKQYAEYQNLLAMYEEYRATLSGLNSDELLLQAYTLGEISFLEYYMELRFYQMAFDSMLEMEHHLYRSLTDLLKHEL